MPEDDHNSPQARKVEELDRRVTLLEREQAVVGVEFLSVKGDLKEIKDALKWVTRLIIGALIMALMAFIVGGGISPV